LATIIAKRLCLHKQVRDQQQQNASLRDQIVRLQALANIGTAACMIAHELNNLLTPAGNYATLALKHPEDHQLAAKALEKTVQSCRQAARIMNSMLAVANGKAEPRQGVELRKLVEEVFACLARDFSKDGIRVSIEIPRELTIEAVAVQIQQVFMNLIFNAREAMLGAGGTLRIVARERQKSVRIEVSDTGRGIKPEVLERIFEPFFTTKISGEEQSSNGGCGLGLAFCRQVIHDHGGTIEVESEPGRGTTFRITLPRGRSAAD